MTVDADWAALPASKRTAIKKAVIAAVVERIESPHFPGDVQETPELIPIDVTHGEQITIRFIASHVMYCRTISGSDWVDHFMFVGRATTAPNAPVTVTLEEDHRASVTESEYTHYDARAAIDEVCKRALAGADAQPSQEQQRVRRIVDAEAAVARQRTTEWCTIVRCPKCGSTAAGAADYIFEITDMRCPQCGHRELADNEQIGESWNVRMELPIGAELPAFVAAAEAYAPAAVPASADASAPPPAATDASKAPQLRFDPEPAGELAADLRCPQCGSSDVVEDAGRAERHFTFLACKRCGHGEEISSLGAASRWR